MSFQQPEKYTLLRQGGIISMAIVLYMFRRKKVSNAGAEINRAHTSWLPYAVLVSLFVLVSAGIELFQKGYRRIREGREKDEVGDQKHGTSYT